MKTQKCILICPLNWGIGHASRMVPLIQALVNLNYRVLIAASGKSHELLRLTFPELQFINAPHLSVTYSERWPMAVNMTCQLPKILFGIVKDYIWLKKLIPVYNIDLVISDNRYGLFNRKIISILVTHQIYPLMPNGLKWAEPFVKIVISKFIKAFDRCWVPDYEDPVISLTGRLSHRNNILRNISFMGILSRFCMYRESKKNTSDTYDIVVILSGPEPQRSILEKIAITQLSNTNYKSAVICGINKSPYDYECFKNINFFDHLDIFRFRQVLINAGIIICRAGYSAIMDLAELRLNAILIPTPGQPEQEYLASYLEEKGLFYQMKQHDFNIEKAIQIYRSDAKKIKLLPETDIKVYLSDMEILLTQVR